MSKPVWTDEQISILRADWALGVTASEIGRRLGYSKNAVVGKVHRLDLESRPTPILPPRIVQPRLAAFALPQLPSLAQPAWNAKRAPSQATHDRVVKLLSDGISNVNTAACVGLTIDDVRKIRKTIVVPARIAAPRAIAVDKQREYSDRDIEFLKRSKRHQAGYIAAQASGFGERFQFGKQTERRKPAGKFPTQDEIAAHIAARGVTMCPTAAAAATSGAIAAKDRVVLAEYRNARNAEWDIRNAPRNKQHAAAMRS